MGGYLPNAEKFQMEKLHIQKGKSIKFFPSERKNLSIFMVKTNAQCSKNRGKV